ncbi:MAG: AAA family ATPase [Armatimonadetes bacterium]|nr:AAA family ATPase [Armatimonadota bacterium]MDE2206276.1 AAA family ATPase [Armatimonadota bacterium]
MPPVVHAFADLTDTARFVREQGSAKRFVLVYAHNGTGKTRLCSEFKTQGQRKDDDGRTIQRDTLYFNAYTEDLFTWDNDLEKDQDRVLEFNQESSFFDGVRELEMEVKIGELLQRYAGFSFAINYDRKRQTPDGQEVPAPPAVTFFRERDTDNVPIPMKISRGEQNIFVWCWFLANVKLVLDGDEAYDWVKYIYIDDPVSSLDEHNAIVVASHLVQLFRESDSDVPAIVSTHHNLFFNVLHYELKSHFNSKSVQFVLARDRGKGRYKLTRFSGDTPSFHHIAALQELAIIAQEDALQTHHFNQLRTILEKTALFHGYTHFGKCIKQTDDDAEGILHQRFVDLLSHGNYSMFEPVPMGDETKQYFRAILSSFLDKFPFNPDHFPRGGPSAPTP